MLYSYICSPFGYSIPKPEIVTLHRLPCWNLNIYTLCESWVENNNKNKHRQLVACNRFMDEMKLIALYCYLCECYDSTLGWQVQRFSNNNEPAFTDVEVLTIYLFALMEEDKRQVKQIHRFAGKYLRSCFPLLPTYKVYLHRLNRLADCLPLLVEQLRADCPHRKVRQGMLLLDSMPIITCSHKRTGKIGPNLTGKGLCASKNLFYYGCMHSTIGLSDNYPCRCLLN